MEDSSQTGDKQYQRLHAFVSGRVQGVGFRYFVMEAAQQRNLTGWVRNRFDDRVEVLAEGPFEAVNELLAQLWIGPRSAIINDVSFDWLPATGEYKRFGALSTY